MLNTKKLLTKALEFIHTINYAGGGEQSNLRVQFKRRLPVFAVECGLDNVSIAGTERRPVVSEARRGGELADNLVGALNLVRGCVVC